MIEDVRAAFRLLHSAGTFVLPNPWDVASARLLEHLGFPALATTVRDSLLGRARGPARHSRNSSPMSAALTTAVQVQLSVDAESGYAVDPAGVAETVRMLADAGASGVSIEDYDPGTGRIAPVDVAVERIAAAASVCSRYGMVLTGRAENHLLRDQRRARHDHSPGRVPRRRGGMRVRTRQSADLGDIARVVEEVGVAVNVLALRDGLTVPGLADIGVRRVSTGGSLAWAAYGAFVHAAMELRDNGTSTYLDRALPRPLRDAAFGWTGLTPGADQYQTDLEQRISYIHRQRRRSIRADPDADAVGSGSLSRR